MQCDRPEAVLIAGPTGSGKTRLAIEWARALDGEIINADAMQVYRELSILSARPGVDERGGVPHHLFGHRTAGQDYSVGRWLDEVNAVLDDLCCRHKVPVFCGGTGLYFKALLEGLSPIPQIPPDIRARWRQRLREEGAHALHAELAQRDASEAERIAPGDGQRLVRALEVIEATGQALSAQHGGSGDGLLQEFNVRRLVVLLDRDTLYERIDQRFDVMMQQGALEEVQGLLDLDLANDLPAMKAIGVRALGGYLNGSHSLEEAVRIAKRESRNYAKRQMTWCRRQMADWEQIEPTE